MATFIGDISNQLILLATNPGAVTATGNTTGVDASNAVSVVNVVIVVGAVTGTSPTLAVKAQESPDNSTWTDTPEGTLVTLGTANANTVLAFDLPRTTRPFLRLAYTAGGTSPSFTLSNLFIAQRRITGTGQGASTSPTSAA